MSTLPVFWRSRGAGNGYLLCRWSRIRILILNHKYRFIYFKTKKTAGTSIDLAFGRFCDADDVVVSLSPKDELLRQKLSIPGPFNEHVEFRYYDLMDWLRFLIKGRRRRFNRHESVGSLKSLIARETWETYFKFCFDRNPYDKAISAYYWWTQNTRPRPGIEEFIEQAPEELLSNWNTYTIDDQVAVDFLGRYEHLEEDLRLVAKQLNLPHTIELPRAKANHRLDREHYSNVLNDKCRSRIESVCKKEISHFGYEFDART